MSARQFDLELKAEWRQIEDDIGEAIVMIATDALAGVVEKSPVDEGTFQNNWLVSVATEDQRTIALPGTFASENAGALAAYAAAEGFPIIFLQNNLPYANRLENGYSNQAPNGMVALTVAEVEAKWDGEDI